MLRWRTVAMPAGLANIAPASPTNAAPAPPRAADRVDPGMRGGTLPAVWAVKRRRGWAVSKTEIPTAQPLNRLTAFIESAARSAVDPTPHRSEEHTSELQSHSFISYA